MASPQRLKVKAPSSTGTRLLLNSAQGAQRSNVLQFSAGSGVGRRSCMFVYV